NHIRHGKRLGQRAWIMKGQHRDCGAEPDPPGALGHGTEEQCGIGCDAVRVKVMFGYEKPIVSESVRQHRLIDDFAIERRNRTRTIRIMVLYRENRELHVTICLPRFATTSRFVEGAKAYPGADPGSLVAGRQLVYGLLTTLPTRKVGRGHRVAHT